MLLIDLPLILFLLNIVAVLVSIAGTYHTFSQNRTKIKQAYNVILT
jgi:hypothetical protein